MGRVYQELTAKDNPAVKLYKKLAGSKKARTDERAFVLEGYRLVSDALANGAAVTKLFITAGADVKYGDELCGMADEKCRIYRISDELGRHMAETEATQGVFAVCSLPKEKPLCEFVKKDGVYAVLYQLQDPGNAGMILRTADALGVDGVIFSRSCDIYSPKVVRATMGSLFRVPVAVCSDVDEIFRELSGAGIESDAAVVRGDAVMAGSCSYPENGRAVWIGNEGNGLPDEISDRCHRRITIPMHGNIESLNAAMAAGILMWEMTKGSDRK